MVAEPRRVEEIQAVCAKWELTATPIGRVTDDGLFRVTHDGLVVAAIPGQRLVDDCPIYHPEAREAESARARRRARSQRAAQAADLQGAWSCCSTAPNIASKRWVFEQYDSTVQASHGAGARRRRRRVPGPGRPISGSPSTVDCNNRLVALDPYEGGKADRGGSGAERRLHRGRAARHHRLPQLRQSGEARGVLPVPSKPAAASPTPAAPSRRRSPAAMSRSTTRARPERWTPRRRSGMVGLLERADDRVPSHFRAPGDEILILGDHAGDLGGSAYWAERATDFIGGRPATGRPRRASAGSSGFWSPRPRHGCSARRTTAPTAGSRWPSPRRDRRTVRRRGAGRCRSIWACTRRDSPAEALLYGEDAGRVVVSCRRDRLRALETLAREHGVPVFTRRPGRQAIGRPGAPGAGQRAHVGCPDPPPDLLRGDSPPDAASRTWIARWESKTMCGIIGVSGIPDAARLAYLGLYALQHRGQESAGIVAVDRGGRHADPSRHGSRRRDLR